MKALFTIGMLCIGCLGAAGQELKLLQNLSSHNDRADRLFEKGEYEQSAQLYEKAYSKDTTNLSFAIQAAESHRLIRNYERATKWYEIGLERGYAENDEVVLHYAQSLMAMKSYDEAKIQLAKYRKLVASDERAGKHMATLEDLASMYEDTSGIIAYPLNINTDYAEYSPIYHKEGIIFLSDRHGTEINNAMGWGEEEYATLYYSREKENGQLAEPEAIFPELNATYHEGPLVLNGNQLIFTRVDAPDTKSQEVHLGLYAATFDSTANQWVNIEPLPFNDPTYSVGHPAVLPGGNQLIFASNMPGGRGGTDLYTSFWDEDHWGQPRNLGPEINSKGDELFPFLFSDEELIFSSNGHGGLGDLDIFRVKLTGLAIKGEVENMGHPFNSEGADFGLTTNSAGTAGFFTSNRLKGGLDDDLFSFTLKWTRVDVTVEDNTKKIPLAGSSVELLVNGEAADTQVADATGRVTFLVFPGEQAEVQITADGFVSDLRPLALEKVIPGESLSLKVDLKRLAIEKKPANNSYEQLLDQFHREKVMVQAEGRVFEYREIGNYQYLVNADEKILLSKDPPDVDVPIQERARQKIAEKGIQAEDFITLKNIYFDYNSSELTEEAKLELDKAIQVMQADPVVAFEVTSYADSRGGMSYNDELAFKRSQNIGRYMMEHDIAGSRLILDSYGEQGIINDCGDDQACDELYHAINRRTEIKLVLRKVYH